MADKTPEQIAIEHIEQSIQYNPKYLDLSWLNITTLPTEITQLTHLEALDLYNNRLVTLPAEIGQLVHLKRLDLRNNQLATLPPELGQLINLNELRLNNNKLRFIPPEIEKLTNLTLLDLEKNQLIVLPTKIGQLVNLSELRLSGNKLNVLPAEISQLTHLILLSFSGNPITALPKNITQLTNLKYLEDTDTKLPLVPPEIASKEHNRIASILAFYASYLTRPLNEAKVLFVGQGAVGKTSLVQQILYGTFNQNQNKTEGISINQWQIGGGRESEIGENGKFDYRVSNSESSIKLNVWDFGGQEIMHATHQFFLTKRSLYLLVLDARLTQEENRVEYWLKIIQSFGGESPVLVVGNKTDQHPLDIDRTGLSKKYPNVVGIFETSAATGAGIKALKAGISNQVDTLPHVRDLLPERWFAVKSKLENFGKKRNFITRDEYLGLCDTNDVTDETSQHTLIGFLHDLGVVLHFQDDPRLEALGILNPQWVTNGVYKILNSHELFQSQGKLTLPLLNTILNLAEYPKDKRLFIVDMMKKFELCYDIESDKSFLIPDLLPKDEPFTGEWNDALRFQIRYNILPSSIISRFIVRMNAFVHKTIWRSGVILKSGGNTALVKADIEDRKIYISVSGDENTRRDFLSAIRMEFDAIHKTIAKIDVTEGVPHPGYPELVLDYSELIEFERQGVNEFPKKVGNQVIRCNVRELLDGVRPLKNQVAKVFISYARKDKSFVKKLAGELEGQGIIVWWDYDSLKGGQDWQKEIERGIKQCNFFLVTLTPEAIASEWVGNEITYASQIQKTIIPLHLKECDIPIGLIQKQYIDFEKQTQKAAIKELTELLKIKP